MTDNFLPFALPDIGEEEIAEVVDALKSGWVTLPTGMFSNRRELKSYIKEVDKK